MKTVFVKFENSALNYYTSVSDESTLESVTDYYVGSILNLGCVNDDLHKCIGIDFIETEKQRIQMEVDKLNTLLGINIKPCNYFTGYRNNGRGVYFNVIFEDRINYSNRKYSKLCNYLESQNLYCGANGSHRAAIFVELKK